MSDKDKDIDTETGIETTGHEWDGIKELNNPLPRWWLIILWISVVWAVVYWILMPSWPGVSGHFAGVRGHSERANVDAAIEALDAERGLQMEQLMTIESIADVERDPQLLQFAMNAGASLFGDNCATCHGAGGQGFKGYPSLIDDSWIWGGTLDDIKKTLHHGIRAVHPETRNNLMQGYGEAGIYDRNQIGDLIDYVINLSGGEANAEAVERAAPLFAQQCATCHGAEGKGDQSQGAPNLTDQIWLYGGSRSDLRQTLYYGRAGVMPYWTDRLTDQQITALSVYVHSLGGGE